MAAYRVKVSFPGLPDKPCHYSKYFTFPSEVLGMPNPENALHVNGAHSSHGEAKPCPLKFCEC